MIQLNKHIEILLLDNDCVIVPGLGGFMAHHVEARFDDRDNSFLPPLRMLGFNQQLKLNDSLLVQSYIETYDMSYPEALRRIESEVEELKQHLYNEGSYELEDIGMLTTNEHGDIIFEPFEAGILTPELYGLSAFEFKPFNIESLPIVENIATDITPVEEIVPEIIDEEEDEADDDNVIKIRVAWIRNVAAAAAAIIAFFFMASPVTNSTKDKVMLSGVMIPELLSSEINTVDVKSVEFKTITPVSDSIAIKDTTNIVSDSIENKQAVELNNNYCIILASRVTKRNAESFVSELHKNGYDQAYTYINNKIVRVAYGDYSSLQDAYNALAKIKTNKKYEQAWVLKKQ